MYRRISAFVALRRTVALLAALGAGIAVFMVSPAAASAAATGAPPPAPATAQSVSVTAPASSAGIDTLSTLPTILCTLYVDYPSVSGNASNSYITATSEVQCIYTFNGQPVAVDIINIFGSLKRDGSLMASDSKGAVGQSYLRLPLRSSPCQAGHWDNVAGALIYWPAGYTDRDTGQPYTEIPTFVVSSNIVSCPGAPPVCAITCPGIVGGDPVAGAEPAVRTEDSLPEAART